MSRSILHCDMNNFYASVECMLDPVLKKYPVAVCGSVEERHGIVLAKNYAAKAFGIKTGDAVWQAKQKCRNLVVVPPHFEEYIKYSKLARNVYQRYTDQVEPYGMDECWLDISGTDYTFGSPEKVANDIRETIKFELGLTISVGVSFNKIFAKLGSDMKKPDAVTDGRKALVGIGTKILIFPDKLAFDTADGSVTALGALWTAADKSVTFAPCDAAGKTYQVEAFGRDEPADPADGQLFLRVEDADHPWRYDSTLEMYSKNSGSWAAIPLEYCRITAAGLGKLFRQWDTVTVQGAAAETAGQSPELNGDQIVYDMGEDWLRVRCTPQGEYFYGTLVQNAAAAQWQSMDGKQHRSVDAAQTVSMERRVPELDFVTECDNRVWGCNSRENVIYGCKLGDPTNWFSYRGIAADSYAVTVGSDGAFTGAASCMGYALFFKENTLHKLYGSKPSDFQLSSLRCRGVAKNAARSLCVLNETLYYLSPDGVMAWDGSLPTKVSGALDAAKLANVQSAVGGALDGRYYLHISRESARLLVYDTEKGLWSEEDVCSCDMTSTGGQLYLWDGQALWAADPTREPDWQSTDSVETDIPFELVTGDVGLDGTEQRYLSRLTLRLDAERTSTVEVAVSYDGGAWETVASLAAQGSRRSYDLPFVPRRCGSLRLRLRGKGQITLRSLVRTIAPAKGKLWEEDTSWQA